MNIDDESFPDELLAEFEDSYNVTPLYPISKDNSLFNSRSNSSSELTQESVSSNDRTKHNRNVINKPIIKKKSQSYQDLNNVKHNLRYRHVTSKVKTYITNIQESDNKKKIFKRHKSMPGNYLCSPNEKINSSRDSIIDTMKLENQIYIQKINMLEKERESFHRNLQEMCDENSLLQRKVDNMRADITNRNSPRHNLNPVEIIKRVCTPRKNLNPIQKVSTSTQTMKQQIVSDSSNINPFSQLPSTLIDDEYSSDNNIPIQQHHDMFVCRKRPLSRQLNYNQIETSESEGDDILFECKSEKIRQRRDKKMKKLRKAKVLRSKFKKLFTVGCASLCDKINHNDSTPYQKILTPNDSAYTSNSLFSDKFVF